MNTHIVEAMFSQVKKGDDFYFLGDIGWDIKLIDYVLEEAKEKKIRFHWILGNHDKRFEKQYRGRIKEFNSSNTMHDILEVKLTDRAVKHYPTTLCHYPMMTWNKSHYNAFLLFGHHHVNTHKADEIKKLEKSGKMLNVNCEFHNYKPWHELEIIEEMSTRPDNWDIIKGDDGEKKM